MTNTTEASTIARLAEDGVLPRVLEPGVVYAVKNELGGVEVINTDEYAPVPRRIVRSATAATADTFTTYLDGRSLPTGDVEVWADLDKRRVVAILDAKRWRDDRITLALQHSPEWKAWIEASGNLYRQASFADFLEDQLGTIAEPDGATLLEIVQSIQGSTKATWKSADWLDNGARGFQWVEEVDGKAGRKGTLEIPSRFTLGLRPFLGSPQYKVTAALRYRMEAGGLAVGFKLIEPQRIVETAFAEIVEQIDSGIAQPIYYGQPD